MKFENLPPPHTHKHLIIRERITNSDIYFSFSLVFISYSYCFHYSYILLMLKYLFGKFIGKYFYFRYKSIKYVLLSHDDMDRF